MFPLTLSEEIKMSKLPAITTNTNTLKGVSVLRLGKTAANNCKVYISNKSLLSVFPVGEKVKVNYDIANKQITVKQADLLSGNHTISKKGNGTPVLDIKGKKVAETFGKEIEKIEVLYYENQIVIKIAKSEHFKAKRAEKKGKNTFELFAGAGTLTHFFKEAGFNVRGGLELDDDYLALFHTNNPGEEIYSIGGRLEDIHTSYYPRDIDIVLSGIPCTNYSVSNVKLKEAQKAKREGKEYDEAVVAKEYEAEALTFYVLTAIRAMNPKTVVVEEVVPYSESPASMMLRTVLTQMGYDISETVATGKHTKRKRWVLVANMGKKVNLDNLITDDGKTIVDFLENPLEEREWKPASEHPRIAKNVTHENRGVGIRSVLPSETMTNTFTTHWTRGTEPILQYAEGVDLYCEFSNREIANIHGIASTFELDSRKSISRQIVGQGVTDMFAEAADRILEANFNKRTIAARNFYDYRTLASESLCVVDKDFSLKSLSKLEGIKTTIIENKSTSVTTNNTEEYQIDSNSIAVLCSSSVRFHKGCNIETVTLEVEEKDSHCVVSIVEKLKKETLEASGNWKLEEPIVKIIASH